MPQSFTDQFYLFDPANPPPPGTAVTWTNLVLTDQNDDNDFDRFNNDRVNGSDITASFRGDTVTINVPGVGNVTYLDGDQIVAKANDRMAKGQKVQVR